MWFGSSRILRPRLIRNYRTCSEHRHEDGTVYPVGTFCLAMRSDCLEKLYLHFKDGKTIVLGSGHGLYGHEPGILHPALATMENLNTIIRKVDASCRVWLETGEETLYIPDFGHLKWFHAPLYDIELDAPTQQAWNQMIGSLSASLSKSVQEELDESVLDDLERIVNEQDTGAVPSGGHPPG